MNQRRYKVLENYSIKKDKFSIRPLRHNDRFQIMQWRNEQLYHLRQRAPLTEEIQDEYFNTVVASLFDQDKPDQILFSYLKENECIGYGGLVHINWHDKNAEISFVMNTQLEKDFFDFHWGVFLDLLEEVAFEDLQFHKIFIYAFDVRPHLFRAVEKKGYQKEAVLREHYLIDGIFKDVIIHSKFNK